MANTERRVDMVRLERPEEVYDVEEVLGRDIKSVFPTKANSSANAVAPGQLDADTVREMIGGKKFVSQKELEDIQARRGHQSGATESSQPLRPLVEVLREAKEQKEQAFQDMWKQMKTGKNRALDEDELAFLESVAEQEAAKRRGQLLQEKQELEEFRKAAAAAAGQGLEADTAGPAGSSRQQRSAGPQEQQKGLKPAGLAKPLVRAVIKPRAKGPEMQPSQQGGFSTAGAVAADMPSRGAVGDEAAPPSKRLKFDAQAEQEQQTDEEGAGLAGLLGYDASDDDN